MHVAMQFAHSDLNGQWPIDVLTCNSCDIYIMTYFTCMVYGVLMYINCYVFEHYVIVMSCVL